MKHTLDLVSCLSCDFEGEVGVWVDTCPSCNEQTLILLEHILQGV